MIVKPFLKRPEVVKKVFSKTHNKSVLQLFNFFAENVTSKAVTKMYKMLESSWGKYDLEPQYHGAVHIKNQVDEMHVINRRTGDIFVVKTDYSCWCEGARCWQQNYCGHHCPHSITTCVRHITDCSSDKNGLYNLMVSALSICNPVWLRST